MIGGVILLKHSNNKKLKLRLLIVLFLLLDITLFVVFSQRLNPIVNEIAINNAKNLATQSVNDAVSETMKEMDIDYDGIMSLEKDNNGEISAIKANTLELNLFKNDVVNKILKKIEVIERSNMGVPIGNLMGTQILSGRGPRIPVRIDNISNVNTKVINNFKAVGINQTQQTVTLEVSMNMTVLISNYYITTTVATDYPIADTIIVGKVPENYTVIDENSLSGDDTAKKVYIYGNKNSQ